MSAAFRPETGFSLAEMAAWRATADQPVVGASIPQLWGCPHCSHPPRIVQRPWIVEGRRSGVYVLAGCTHVFTVFPGFTCAASEPSKLAGPWDAWATAELAAKYSHLAPDSHGRLQAFKAMSPEGLPFPPHA